MYRRLRHSWQKEYELQHRALNTIDDLRKYNVSMAHEYIVENILPTIKSKRTLRKIISVNYDVLPKITPASVSHSVLTTKEFMLCVRRIAIEHASTDLAISEDLYAYISAEHLVTTLNGTASRPQILAYRTITSMLHIPSEINNARHLQ